MNQLQEIIQILSTGDEGTTDALIKTKILLFSIGKKELAAWVMILPSNSGHAAK
ncbi:hypothetical protein [Escherichia coli]|uniref:hypothetical protein n=1 Tax=Escherichia coli TaxID=562 RepID=UPI0034D76A63